MWKGLKCILYRKTTYHLVVWKWCTNKCSITKIVWGKSSNVLHTMAFNSKTLLHYVIILDFHIRSFTLPFPYSSFCLRLWTIQTCLKSYIPHFKLSYLFGFSSVWYVCTFSLLLKKQQQKNNIYKIHLTVSMLTISGMTMCSHSVINLNSGKF